MQTLYGIGALGFNATGVHDYASYFTTMDRLGIRDREEALRRVVFNVLAPAYDVTFAYSPTSKWVSRHLMSVEGRFEGIRRVDLETLGDRAGVAGYRDIIARVADAVARFDTFADAAGISAGRRREIEARLALVLADAAARPT